MKYLLEVSLVAFLLAGSGAAQSGSHSSSNTRFNGTWEGKLNDLPAIALDLDAVNNQIKGTVTFYSQTRSDPAKPWNAGGAYTVPVLAPVVNGGVLTFEVEHHRCHGCAELGPNARFRMALVGSDEARLWNVSEQWGPKDGFRLVRQTHRSSAPQAERN